MTNSLDKLRREAKDLKKAYEAGDAGARARMRAFEAPKHADFLHVVARAAGFASWPAMKRSAEIKGMDLATRQARLRQALFHGEAAVVADLLAETSDIAQGEVPLLAALYDVDGMRTVLDEDPDAATRTYPPRRAMCHLAFSRHVQAHPELEPQMLAMAELLVAHGADVNDTWPWPEDNAPLSALYGALGHVGSMALGRWLLEHGANPNDNESLYHATEMGHADGVHLLLAHGATVDGTNALLRAMDFDNVEMVRAMLNAGGTPDGGAIPALHQAARRGCSAEMVEVLLEAGAAETPKLDGMTPYAYARIIGNHAMARVLEGADAATPLSAVEAQLARAADDDVGKTDWIDMAQLSPEQTRLMCRLTGRADVLPHMTRLAAMGFDTNAVDEQGMPPLHLAGWMGLLDQLNFFLRQKPDMGHVNAYGGTLFSTILHGSENCPERATRDHIGCMHRILELGVALPAKAPDQARIPEMAELLRDRARSYPGQVVAHGVI